MCTIVQEAMHVRIYYIIKQQTYHRFIIIMATHLTDLIVHCSIRIYSTKALNK